MSANATSLITGAQVLVPAIAQQLRQMRGNPMDGATPATVKNWINAFEAGHLRPLSLLFDRLSNGGDADITTGYEKRVESVASLPWEIVTAENLEPKDDKRAALHREALLYTFENLTTRSAVEPDAEGEVADLVRHLMSSVFVKYAVAETVWQASGKDLTLQAITAPVSCFSTQNGPLQYVGPSGSGSGPSLSDGGWLVAVRGTLAAGLAQLWILGSQNLRDWLEFNHNFTLPGFIGKCSSSQNTEPWNNFVDAINQITAQWALVIGKDEEVEAITAGTTGGIDCSRLDEVLSRRKITLALGSDLGTHSGKDRQGASLQAQDGAQRVAGDCRKLEGVLNRGLVRTVIANVFGPNEKPLAWFRLREPVQRDDELELKIDDGLARLGVQQSTAAIAERYGRAEVEPGSAERVATIQTNAPQANPAEQVMAGNPADTLANEAPADALPYDITRAVQEDLQPLATALASAVQAGGTITEDELKNLQTQVLAGSALEDSLRFEWMKGLLIGAGLTEAGALRFIAEQLTTPNPTPTV